MATTRVEFTEDVLAEIATAMPPWAEPERVALLAELLRAWAAEDLVHHLSREKRSVMKHRIKQMRAVQEAGRRLLATVEELDDRGTTWLADDPQLHREALNRDEGVALLRILQDWKTGERRREEALSWA